jgi:hypothetical protein
MRDLQRVNEFGKRGEPVAMRAVGQNGPVWSAFSWAVLACAFHVSAAGGEERIIDAEPYDQLVLKAEGRVFKLALIEMAKRAPPRDQDPESHLIVRLFDRPQQRYQVQWKFIDRVELFEELVLGEAAKLVAEKKYDDAYQYFIFLHGRSPEFPGLAAARQDCLLSEAKHFLELQRNDQALLVLTELYEQNRDYAGLRDAMGSAVNDLVERHFASGQDAAARELVEQLASRYADHEVVLARRRQLIERAEGFLQAARLAMENQQWRESHDAVETALSVWPDLAEARRVAEELNRRYPIVRVGVRDLGGGAGSPGLVLAWAQLRQQRLTARRLFEATAFTAAGGEYQTPLGAYKVDARTLTFTVDPRVRWSASGRSVSSADIAAGLSIHDERESSGCGGSWGGWAESVRAVDERSLEIVWRRQPPVWEAWLQAASPVSVRGDMPEADRVGPYRQVTEDGGDVRFLIQPHYFAVQEPQPREIIERKFDSTIDALRALDQRRILVFDRAAPWERATARAHANVTLVPYAAPSVHLLVPNPHSALMTSGAVRRAVDVAIDRDRILRDVLGDGTAPAGEVISGPFPRGYAYDDKVAPAEHDPRAAIALLHGELAKDANNVQPRSITLVYPRSDLARRAATAIQEDLSLDGLGLQVNLREVTADDESQSASSWDLLYVEWQAIEPARDVWKLLGGTRWGRAADPELDAALEQLAQAATRDQAAAPLRAIHRRVQEQLAIIPLWQIDEYALVHQSLRGVGERPVTLYQNVEQWQVTSEP